MRTSGEYSTFSAAQSSLSGSLNGSVCVVFGTDCIWETLMAQNHCFACCWCCCKWGKQI